MSIKNEVDQVHMNNVMDRCFHLAMKGSVQSKIDSCSLYIEPPNMSQFSIFNLKRADEIMAINTHVLSKKIKELNL
jgi:NTE family protein